MSDCCLMLNRYVQSVKTLLFKYNYYANINKGLPVHVEVTIFDEKCILHMP